MTKLKQLQKTIQRNKQAITLIPLSMSILKPIFFDKKIKSLHIACIAFLTLFFTETAFLNNFEKRSIDLRNYHHHLMRYQDKHFAQHLQF